MSRLDVDDALRELNALAHAKGEVLAMLSQLHRDTLQLLVTSPKDRGPHAAASKRLARTLVETRQLLEAHGGKM